MTASPETELIVKNVFGSYPNIVLFVDLDDTLTDTAGSHESAALGLEDSLRHDFRPTKARHIVQRFSEVFDELLQIHQAHAEDEDHDSKPTDDNDLPLRVDECQKDIRIRWGGIKKFSREVLLFLAAQDVGVHLTPSQVDSYTDLYWRNLDLSLNFIDGAVELTQEVGRIGVPLYIMTSSDARLSLNTNGQFIYRPMRSKQFKQDRLRHLRERGLWYVDAVLGDPIDKPDPRFFEQLRQLAAHQAASADLHQIVLIGDSYSSDLETPLEMWKEAQAVLFKSGQRTSRREADRIISIGEMSSLRDALTVLERNL